MSILDSYRKMLYMKKPGFESFSGRLLLPLTAKTWAVLSVTVLVFIILLSVTWHLGYRYRTEHDEKYTLYNSVFCMVGIFCKQSKQL
jgi:hypothetical protein